MNIQQVFLAIILISFVSVQASNASAAVSCAVTSTNDTVDALLVRIAKDKVEQSEAESQQTTADLSQENTNSDNSLQTWQEESVRILMAAQRELQYAETMNNTDSDDRQPATVVASLEEEAFEKMLDTISKNNNSNTANA